MADIDTSDELSARPAIGDAVDRHIRAIEDWLPVVEDEHLSEQQAIHSKLLLALTDRMPARLNTLALRCWRAAIRKVQLLVFNHEDDRHFCFWHHPTPNTASDLSYKVNIRSALARH
jgi:hypothetical protein